MQPLTLCAKFASWNAERPLRHSHCTGYRTGRHAGWTRGESSPGSRRAQ